MAVIHEVQAADAVHVDRRIATPRRSASASCSQRNRTRLVVGRKRRSKSWRELAAIIERQEK